MLAMKGGREGRSGRARRERERERERELGEGVSMRMTPYHSRCGLSPA